MKKERICMYSLLVIFSAFLLSSCSKEKFRMFEDLDCITTEEVVKIDIPLTEIPGKGGSIKLTPSIYTEITYWQRNVAIDVKQEPITDYEVHIVDAPVGTTVQRTNEGIVLIIPENTAFNEVPVVIKITAKGVTQQFAFMQKRLKYKIDVELS